MDDLELRVAWEQHLGIDRNELLAVLVRHREPHRRYHGERHVRWVVRHAQRLAEHARTTLPGRPVDLGAVIAATFYHDAIYDPRATRNETASARLASQVLTRCEWPSHRVEMVAAMIEATADHHHAVGPDGADVSTAIMLAADLAVLAADPAGYEAYVNGVRFEYSHVAAADWASGRSAVLRGFIGRNHIYPPELQLADWEARARANITAELATLEVAN